MAAESANYQYANMKKSQLQSGWNIVMEEEPKEMQL